MPQMAPISWLFLFIIFSITLIIFSTINYFSFNTYKNSNSNNSNIKMTSLNWKW